MKYIIDGFLIVEGKDDKSYLSSFLDAEIFITNGFDIYSDDFPYLISLSKKYTPIILTDSDDAGKNIRQKLSNLLPDSKNAEVNILKCNKKHKHGVAECEKDEIINKLKPYFIFNKVKHYEYTLSDLINFGVKDKASREIVCLKLGLGKCNTKQLAHRLSVLEIPKDDIINVLK